MATRVPTETSIQGGDGVSILWSGLAGGTADVGTEVTLARFGSISIQVGGTFGTTTLAIQGSNDGTTWTTLIDMQGANMSFTAAAFKTLRDVPRYIRPSTPTGTGTGIWVSLFGRRSV